MSVKQRKNRIKQEYIENYKMYTIKTTGKWTIQDEEALKANCELIEKRASQVAKITVLIFFILSLVSIALVIKVMI